MALFMVDISSNNHPLGAKIDWNVCTDVGVQGAIIKVNEADYFNPQAKADYDDSEAAGIACLGLYDFARQDLDSGARDAQLFLAGVGNLGGIKPGTRYVLDIEEHSGGGPQVPIGSNLAAYCLDWASVVWPIQVRKDDRRKPILYSRTDYLSTYHLVNNSALDAAFDLWLVGKPGIAVPPGWSHIEMYQVDWFRKVTGITGSVDANIFTGRAYDWLSKSWGYQTSPLNAPVAVPDIDPNADLPTILSHVDKLVNTVVADLGVARTKFPWPVG